MSIEEILAELRKDYLQAMPEKFELIEKLSRAGETRKLETEFHKLKGTGKTYGLGEVSDLGATVERLLQQQPGQASDTVTLALEVMRTIHKTRVAGNVPDLESMVPYQQLKRRLGND